MYLNFLEIYSECFRLPFCEDISNTLGQSFLLECFTYSILATALNLTTKPFPSTKLIIKSNYISFNLFIENFFVNIKSLISFNKLFTDREREKIISLTIHWFSSKFLFTFHSTFQFFLFLFIPFIGLLIFSVHPWLNDRSPKHPNGTKWSQQQQQPKPIWQQWQHLGTSR